jgi:hypothetical protein
MLAGTADAAASARSTKAAAADIAATASSGSRTLRMLFLRDLPTGGYAQLSLHRIRATPQSCGGNTLNAAGASAAGSAG